MTHIKLRSSLLSPAVWLCAGLFLFYFPVLTNDITVAGDGLRVLRHIETVDHSKELYPLWMPDKLLGLPVLADPERFTWIGYLLDFDDPYFFLKFNILMFAMVGAFAAVLYRFYRALHLSPEGSAFAAFSVSVSGMIGVVFYLGRIYALLNLIFALWAMTLYLKSEGRPGTRHQISIMFLTGACLATVGYYALVFPLGALFLASLVYKKQTHTWIRSLQCAVLDSSKYLFGGTLLFAVFVIPLFIYSFNTLSVEASMPFHESLFDPASFINVFMPLEQGGIDVLLRKHAAHISFLLLPGLILFLSGWERDKTPETQILIWGVVLTPVFFLAAIPVLGWFLWVYERLPVISHIRQSTIYFSVFVIFSMALAVKGLEKNVPSLQKCFIFLAAAVGVLGILGLMGGPFIANYTGGILGYLFVMAMFLYSYPKLRTYKNALPILFIVTAVVYLALPEQLALQDHVVRGGKAHRVAHTRKVEDLDRLPEGVLEPGYHRLYCSRAGRCPPFGSAGLPTVQGFSYYFDPALRPVFEAISINGSQRQRPHWMNFQRCDQLAPVWMDMLNIRYVMCPTKVALSNHFRRIDGVKESWVNLYEYTDWRPAVRLFSKWKTGENVSREDIETAWTGGVALIDQPVSVSVQEKNYLTYNFETFSEGEIVMSIDSSGGIVYLPELYSPHWIVRVDDKPAELLRTFGSFRGVAVSPGQHNIAFSYRPVFVYLSFLISVFAFGICAIGWKRAAP